jgi:glycosyltransferase involved in cell wall biosynthesis
MKLSVIVPSFNAADTISGQLEALANQQWNQPWEVIVADNGSGDETVAIRKASSLRLIAQNYSKKILLFRVIDASDKKGGAHARNLGASVAKGEALAFCDADDEVAPGWVAAMGEALSKYDFVAGRNQHWKLNEPWLVKSYRVENGDGIAGAPQFKKKELVFGCFAFENP